MVIFHSYISLPEGIFHLIYHRPFQPFGPFGPHFWTYLTRKRLLGEPLNMAN
jgi:hypothetical protein